MKFEPVSIFNYYYDNMMERLVQQPLLKQLDTLQGCNVLVLDYCGQSHSFIKPFRDIDARIFLLEDYNENVSSIHSEYDIVYVITSEIQDYIPSFRSINVVFRLRNIIKIEYIPGNRIP
ncbi:hypothetical protein PAEPH01_2047 [Pancytospora epiphaga]|nr:hypothetical protein PAEPH01_2047 [Pancytospora epiphaga]